MPSVVLAILLTSSVANYVGDSLVQTSKSQSKEEQAPEPAEPGFMNWDGTGAVNFTFARENVEGYPAQYLFRIPKNQVTYNETHVKIHFLQNMSGLFLRKFNALDSVEYGWMSWYWNHNLLSVMGPQIKVGAAEKMHTLNHQGTTWSNVTLDHVRAVQAARTDADNHIAAASFFQRSGAVNGWAIKNEIGVQSVRASLDMNAMMDMEHYYQQFPNTGTDPGFDQMQAALEDEMTNSHNEYKQGLNDNSEHEASSTGNNCFHLHDSPHIDQSDGDGVWVKRGHKIGAARGHTVFIPEARFAVLVGTAVMDIHGDYLDIYFAATTMSNFAEHALQDAKFFVGRGDGHSRPHVPEGRMGYAPENPEDPIIASHLYRQWNNLPEDYTIIEWPADTFCPPATRDNMLQAVGSIPLFDLVYGNDVSEQEKYRAVQTITGMTVCTTNYLKPDVPFSVTYNPLQAIVVNHGTIEFFQSMFERFWNDVPHFLWENN